MKIHFLVNNILDQQLQNEIQWWKKYQFEVRVSVLFYKKVNWELKFSYEINDGLSLLQFYFVFMHLNWSCMDCCVYRLITWFNNTVHSWLFMLCSVSCFLTEFIAEIRPALFRYLSLIFTKNSFNGYKKHPHNNFTKPHFVQKNILIKNSSHNNWRIPALRTAVTTDVKHFLPWGQSVSKTRLTLTTAGTTHIHTNITITVIYILVL